MVSFGVNGCVISILLVLVVHAMSLMMATALMMGVSLVTFSFLSSSGGGNDSPAASSLGTADGAPPYFLSMRVVCLAGYLAGLLCFSLSLFSLGFDSSVVRMS